MLKKPGHYLIQQVPLYILGISWRYTQTVEKNPILHLLHRIKHVRSMQPNTLHCAANNANLLNKIKAHQIQHIHSHNWPTFGPKIINPKKWDQVETWIGNRGEATRGLKTPKIIRKIGWRTLWNSELEGRANDSDFLTVNWKSIDIPWNLRSGTALGLIIWGETRNFVSNYFDSFLLTIDGKLLDLIFKKYHSFR